MPGIQANPVWLYRLVHVDSLAVLLTRDALHAPNTTPADGLAYRTIHDVNVQASRRVQTVPCGPGGNIHDYVPFYFGPLSPMLLKLNSGQVAGYTEGQEPLVYLGIRVSDVQAAGCRYVFSDGHGLAAFTTWYDDVAQLTEVDWNMVGQRYWSDRPDDNDRQRRKQAEFLVWGSLPWSAIRGIAVLNDRARQRVAAVLAQSPNRHQPAIEIKPSWYY